MTKDANCDENVRESTAVHNGKNSNEILGSLNDKPWSTDDVVCKENTYSNNINTLRLIEESNEELHHVKQRIVDECNNKNNNTSQIVNINTNSPIVNVLQEDKNLSKDKMFNSVELITNKSNSSNMNDDNYFTFSVWFECAKKEKLEITISIISLTPEREKEHYLSPNKGKMNETD